MHTEEERGFYGKPIKQTKPYLEFSGVKTP